MKLNKNKGKSENNQINKQNKKIMEDFKIKKLIIFQINNENLKMKKTLYLSQKLKFKQLLTKVVNLEEVQCQLN